MNLYTNLGPEEINGSPEVTHKHKMGTQSSFNNLETAPAHMLPSPGTHEMTIEMYCKLHTSHDKTYRSRSQRATCVECSTLMRPGAGGQN